MALKKCARCGAAMEVNVTRCPCCGRDLKSSQPASLSESQSQKALVRPVGILTACLLVCLFIGLWTFFRTIPGRSSPSTTDSGPRIDVSEMRPRPTTLQAGVRRSSEEMARLNQHSAESNVAAENGSGESHEASRGTSFENQKAAQHQSQAADRGLASAPRLLAAETTKLIQSFPSKIRIEGTSTIHDWQAESKLIMGFLEVGSNFPLEQGQAVAPGKVNAEGEVFVNVRQLHSVKKDGSFYDDKMDNKMWEMLKEAANPQIVYRLSELVLKEVPTDKSGRYVFDSMGDLAIAGATNKVSMSVNVTPLAGKKVQIIGTTALKMSDFNIDPASVLFAKTSDDVTVTFEWTLAQSKDSTAASK
jgi:hypothetical protein